MSQHYFILSHTRLLLAELCLPNAPDQKRADAEEMATATVPDFCILMLGTCFGFLTVIIVSFRVSPFHPLNRIVCCQIGSSCQDKEVPMD
jgi:hypothetical protein